MAAMASKRKEISRSSNTPEAAQNVKHLAYCDVKPDQKPELHQHLWYVAPEPQFKKGGAGIQIFLGLGKRLANSTGTEYKRDRPQRDALY
jgi:hypothetical protein